jgi:uncharacterized SAM-binding protein YcdF (DUF218 family)
LWRPRRRLVALAAVLLFWLLSAGWLTRPLLAVVQRPVSDTAPLHFGPRTFIVMLGNGTERTRDGKLVPKSDALPRIDKTAAIYADCRSSGARCTVIVSGGNPQHHAQSEADNYAPYLRALHVAPDDLLLENTSLTTYENAAHVARILRDERDETLILVTSAYHMPRAMLDFRRFGLNPQPAVSNARFVPVGLLPRISTLMNANVALHELIGMAQFHVYRALGWF